MKERLGVPEARPLADFLPTITIKAKDFANEITTHNTKEKDLRTESSITEECVANNTEVRRVLGRRGIEPESLPAAEDARRVERRLSSEASKLSDSSVKRASAGKRRRVTESRKPPAAGT